MAFLGRALEFVRRVHAGSRRRELDEQLAEEIRLHLELRARALMDRGIAPEDALVEARRSFGNPTAIREEVRDIRSFRWLEHLVQDVRFGARLLLRTPLFTTVSVLCLAIGVGSSAAVFNVADAVLFRSLDVRDPGQLRAFRATIQLGSASKVMGGVDAATLARLREEAEFADFIGFRSLTDVVIESPGSSRTGSSRTGSSRTGALELVSGNYFAVLGNHFVLGRPLDESDDRAGTAAVVVSERLWRGDFQADPGIIGRSIRLNGQPATIVGVVRTFRGLVPERPADAFAPLSAATAIDPSTAATVIDLFARLRPGVAVPVAEQRLAALYRAAGRVPPGAELRLELYEGARGVSALRASLEHPLRLGLMLVAALLLVACANTAGLLLSRFASRHTEFGYARRSGQVAAASRGSCWSKRCWWPCWPAASVCTPDGSSLPCCSLRCREMRAPPPSSFDSTGGWWCSPSRCR